MSQRVGGKDDLTPRLAPAWCSPPIPIATPYGGSYVLVLFAIVQKSVLGQLRFSARVRHIPYEIFDRFLKLILHTFYHFLRIFQG